MKLMEEERVGNEYVFLSSKFENNVLVKMWRKSAEERNIFFCSIYNWGDALLRRWPFCHLVQLMLPQACFISRAFTIREFYFTFGLFTREFRPRGPTVKCSAENQPALSAF